MIDNLIKPPFLLNDCHILDIYKCVKNRSSYQLHPSNDGDIIYASADVFVTVSSGVKYQRIIDILYPFSIDIFSHNTISQIAVNEDSISYGSCQYSTIEPIKVEFYPKGLPNNYPQTRSFVYLYGQDILRKECIRVVQAELNNL